ncbi:LLM class flavin-dependent oxidoreductase [Terricaulis silvestris]|uniref:Limonene 1,2-monooxygenase n=1 Tax=Terricaulis silvestris TaxID=2686094 RepID=A0A6I6MIR1_9CAUL|nr:LLM class flavin-dependent oxidoreductase [Terricaulis silvestris]QGZ93661.1 Limonene 1,2-monooxygenase [Terricaulis silvestris]
MSNVNLRHGVFLAPLHNVDENPNLLIHRDLELMEWLDKLGFDEAWIGEHHSAGFETIASPELFIAAAVERTKHIRFGTGVISLPYHNPMTVANRVIQLDHQSRGRVMFGFGPGLLVTDAEMLGIDPNKSRDRMAQSLDAILRLLKGEAVTEQTDWYTLKNARVHLLPYSPNLEIAVASAATPSGGRLAGKYGLSMLCVAATDARGGFNVLDVNWKHACDAAAEHGNTMDRNRLRLMGPMHIAETREKARENVRFGLDRYIEYARALTPGRFGDMGGRDPVDVLLDSGHIVIGTPDDAIAVLTKLQDKQGDFGCFLHQAHDWADWEATKKSYELYMRFVAPAFSRANRNRDASLADLKANSAELSGKSHAAAEKAFEKYAKEDETAASLVAAQKSGMIGARKK